MDFAFEGDWVNNNQSRLSNSPSTINIRAIEDTEIFIIKQQDLNKLYVRIPKIERLGRILMEQAYLKIVEQTIENLATQFDLTYFDVNTFFNGVAANGFQAGSAFLTADYVTGGTFSLDGVHPSPRGYSVIANQMIDIINTKYGSNLPTVNPVDYTGLYID